MSNHERIFNNTAIIFVANILKKIIAVFITLLIARSLGAIGFGQFSLAFGFVSLFTIFIDFGAKIYIAREIARARELAPTLVMTTFVMKLMAVLPMVLLVLSASWLLAYPGNIIYLILLASMSIALQSLSEPFNSALKAYEKMHLHALFIVLQAALKLGIAAVVLMQGRGLASLLYGYIIADALSLISAIVLYHTNIAHLRMWFTPATALGILKSSIPFGVAAMFMALYDKIDITMLSKMISNPDAVIGWYSASYNLLFVFEFIPISIATAVYPYAAIAFTKGTRNIQIIYDKLTRYFFLFTFPLAVGGTILASQIIPFLYGDGFEPAIFALQLLIWGVIFRFQMYALGVLLDSSNQEKVTMRATIISFFTNVALNLLLIPYLSFIGACIATIAAEVLYIIICMRAAARVVGWPALDIFYKPIFASAFMAIALMILDFYWLWEVLIGAIIFGIAAWSIGSLREDDMQLVKAYLRKTLFRRKIRADMLQ